MPKLLGEMEFAGRQVVQPITGKEGKLVRPYEEYFTALGVTVEEWFALEEQERKELIRKRDHYQCIITGDSQDHVHEFGTRGAHSVRALVPWNMAGVSAKIHDLFHKGVYTIYRFDPLDTEGGLMIIGANGAPLSRDAIWFYHRDDIREQEEDVLRARKALWRVAERFRQAKKVAPKGFTDVLDWGAQLGYSSSMVKQFIRVARFAKETGLIEMFERLDINTADTLRKIPEEDLKKVLKWFSTLHPAEAWDRFHEKYPSKGRDSAFLIFPKTREYTETTEKSAGDVKYDPGKEMVIRGCIIAGGSKEV